ncbi:MAG: hypothetical protein MJ133_08110 [Lachnospiraceae bacterium]|nr:hypothetical protein [Lachnospiraceae bacterium]
MKIEVLFPEICNLYGDLGNIRYIEQSLKDVEIINTSIKAKPAFVDERVDLIYMGTTTEKGLILAIDALKPYKEKIVELIDKGQFFLITGNALDIFGKYIESDWAEKIEGLGILDTTAKYKMLKRHNSFFVGNYVNHKNDKKAPCKVVGFKSIFGHTYPGESGKACEGMFVKEKGIGRNTEETSEGFRINNFMATYLIGPILPLNPILTEELLAEMGHECEAAFKDTAMKAYKERLDEMLSDRLHAVY